LGPVTKDELVVIFETCCIAYVGSSIVAIRVVIREKNGIIWEKFPN